MVELRFNNPGSNWRIYFYEVYRHPMRSFGRVSLVRKIFGWPFLATGVFNLIGILVNANGAGIGVGFFNTIVGVLLLSPGVKAES